jgi:thiamine biosynthesis lipoprotein
MGTFVSVGITDIADAEANDLFRYVFAEMRKTASLLNHFDSGSEVGRLNSTGKLSDASADTLAVIRRAQYFSGLSCGAFDISVMPLVRLWERGVRDGNPPSTHEIATVFDMIDYRNILIENGSLRFLLPGMQISLAGIAKGYIVDKAIALLQSCGVTRAIVDGGGDIRVISDSDSPPWRIGIRDPLRRKGILCILEAHDLAVASSGPYSHTYNDIIDPRTGKQAHEVVGASVIAEEAADADALATCMTVLGMEAGTALAERQREQNVAALIISPDGTLCKTAGWTDHCDNPYEEAYNGPG